MLDLAHSFRQTAIVIGGCNAIGYGITAVIETHKITDLVGASSFVAASIVMSKENGLLRPSLFFKMDHPRLVLINVAVILWGVRLASYLFRRVLHLGEDKRLRKFFRRPGEPYLDTSRSVFPLRLAIFWTLQSLWGFICMLPVTMLNSIPLTIVADSVAGSSMTTANPWLGLEAISPALAFLPIAGIFLGIMLESVADWQKSTYRNDPANEGHWCDQGLWKLCRYPNYMGELLVWWSVAATCLPAVLGYTAASSASVTAVAATDVQVLLQAVAAGGAHLWLRLAGQCALCLASPAFITWLLLYVSGVPLLEAKYRKQYAGDALFQEYVRRTPLLLPNPLLLFSTLPTAPSKKHK